jgi:epsilon-lactone hydrolase
MIKGKSTMPSQQALAVKTHWEMMAATASRGLSLDELRDVIEAEWTKLTAEPRGVDFVEIDANGVAAMWITPKGCAEDRVVLALHGGGFMSGSMYTHRKMFAHLAKAIGCRALSVDYRRAPERAYPAALDEADDAIRRVAAWARPKLGLK